MRHDENYLVPVAKRRVLHIFHSFCITFEWWETKYPSKTRVDCTFKFTGRVLGQMSFFKDERLEGEAGRVRDDFSIVWSCDSCFNN